MAPQITFLWGRHFVMSVNPWLQRPHDPSQTRWIDGQYCIWDDAPLEEFGQIWIPVCPVCKRGPVDKGNVYCDEHPNGFPERNPFERQLDRDTDRSLDESDNWKAGRPLTDDERQVHKSSQQSRGDK
jgi:hypothetical protein